MDEEILNTVHSIFGPSVKIVDCEKSSSLQQEETLLINGVPIKLDGSNDDAAAIKAALLGGQMPSVDVLNQLLYQAGLLRQPLQLETTLSVKSSMITMEEVCVSQRGKLMDERTCETKEDYIYQSCQKEVWQPKLESKLNDLSIKMGNDSKTYTRKEVTEKLNARANPEKSATFADVSRLNRDNSIKSTNSSEIWDTESTLSDCSTNTFPNGATQTNSTVSSRSAMTTATNTNPMNSASVNVNGNRSSISCDSGHDGIFHSISQSTPWVPWNRNCTTVTGNSFSSCYDMASSSDEAEATQKKVVDAENSRASETKVTTESNCGKLEYRKPQTLTSLPFQSYIDENIVLRYLNGKLVSGPLDCLITHLVPTHDYTPEPEFKFTFLLCSRLFLKPRQLLDRIRQIWSQQQEFTLRTSKARIASKLVTMLAYWIETFPYDFRDELLMAELRAVTKKCADLDEANISKEISTSLQRLVQLLSDLDKYEKKLQSFTKPNLSRSFEDFDTVDNATTEGVTKYSLMRSESQPISRQLKRAGSCFANSVAKVQALSVINICPGHSDLAHQLTAIELDYLSHIGAEELLRAFSLEFQRYVASEVHSANKTTSVTGDSPEKSLNGKTRNLEAYVQWFNRLSYLTATEIVKCYKKKHRVQMIEYWIETARECFNTGNFNSLMAILAGLNLSAVTRLKKTWSKVQSAKFSVLEHQMDPSLNFNSYRSTMKAAVWRSEGATDERQRVVIPFFTLFLKDLCILNESNENRLSNNHVNFEKCSYIAKQAQDFNRWKQTRCPYEKLPNVAQFLQSNEILNEKALLLASFACEVPDSSEEKERYKMLRSATN